MANCLYHPDDCESERTVIISELQGGENDPDQLLDQEVTATAFKAHPYRHPTIGWLSDLADDDARRSVRLLPPLLRPEQRDAGHRRRRGHRRRAAPRRAAFRRHPAGPEPAARPRPSSRSRLGERRVTIREGGHDGVPEGRRITRRRCRDPRLLPAARARRRADRREGPEPLVQLPHAAAAAQRAAVSRARRARPRVVGVRRAAADRAAVSLHRVGRRRPTARRSPPSKRRSLERARRRARATASPPPSSRRPRRSCTRGSCSTTTASPTSRTSSATSRRSPASTSSARSGRASPPSRSRKLRRVARTLSQIVEPHRRLVRSAAAAGSPAIERATVEQA